jgi:hypothetical protein
MQRTVIASPNIVCLRMARRGASATDDQFQQIVDYLTNNFGRSPDPKEY